MIDTACVLSKHFNCLNVYEAQLHVGYAYLMKIGIIVQNYLTVTGRVVEISSKNSYNNLLSSQVSFKFPQEFECL